MLYKAHLYFKGFPQISIFIPGSGYNKNSKMVTFGHRNAKGDLRTPQNLLLLFFVGGG